MKKQIYLIAFLITAFFMALLSITYNFIAAHNYAILFTSGIVILFLIFMGYLSTKKIAKKLKKIIGA